MIAHEMMNGIHRVTVLQMRGYRDPLSVTLRNCEALQVLIVGVPIFFKGAKHRSTGCSCECGVGWRRFKHGDGVHAYTHHLR